MEKQKNKTRSNSLVVSLAIGLFVGPCLGFALLANVLLTNQYARSEQAFDQTVTAIVSTNEYVATLIMQTQVAPTPRP